MTELHFKGKEFVYNHHLSVPVHSLDVVPRKSIGKPRLDGNLIVQGDNLYALKALIPLYARKVDCIFIDPPYNTGNEGWCYSDSVNSPMMKEWFSNNPVVVEDGLRHDKWCAMMWPRLRLLRELLSNKGSIWITIDNNEVHRLKMMLDEIFGKDSFIEHISWEKRYTTSNNAKNIVSVTDHILVYKNSPEFQVKLTKRDDKTDQRYRNPDNDFRGPWKATPFISQAAPDKRPNLCYPITNPNTGKITTPTRKAWRNTREVYEQYAAENRLWWGKDGKKSVPDIKSFLNEVRDGIVPKNLWKHEFAGNTDNASKEIKEIFGGGGAKYSTLQNQLNL